MPLFMYKVKDNIEETKTGTMESLNEETLIKQLQHEGYLVLDIRQIHGKARVKSSKVIKEFKPDHDPIKVEDLLVFSRQLATMLAAGVTMLRSLNIIIAQIQSRQLLHIVMRIRDDVEHGSPLSLALAKYPKVFNQFWVSLVEVGEASGTMPKVLKKLADHIEKDAAFRSAIVSALIYPLVLCVVCLGAVVFFALFVAPRFETIFSSMHAQLPGMTKILLATFSFIKHYFLWIMAAVVVLFFLIRSYIHTSLGRVQYEQLIFSFPIVGEVTTFIIVERFCSQMAILVESGVPLLYSLEIVEKMVDNKICAAVITHVREQVKEGIGVADAMMEEGFFPIMAVQMIKVGEESGDLVKMLQHVADFYQSNVEAFMKRFGTLIEPFLLVFMAVVIGIVVISIFLPLFKMGQGFHAQ